MMKFRTIVPIPTYPFQVETSSRLIFLGSCFAEHIADYFGERRFAVCKNPLGILFNPLSIATALNLLIGKQQLSDANYLFFNDKWVSLLHHGRFSHPDKAHFIHHIETSLQQAQNALQAADYLFITLGTSYYYYHKERSMVVANCHKIPAYCFEKRRADVSEIVAAFQPFFAWKSLHNPNLQVIFTVSPVRHLADGFHKNQLSKSALHLAVEAIIQQHGAYYFPSYEIFHDDLRDYRFYDNDLCHPSPQGIAYVEELLAESLFSATTLQQIKNIEKVNRRAQHRPLYAAQDLNS